MKRRVLSFMITLALCLELCPGWAFAAAAAPDGALCPHHPEHTAECGYKAPTEGSPCTHEHDENCGYVAAVPAVPCDKDCTDTDGDGVIDHVGDCAYAPAVEDSPCTHEHDESCGYVAEDSGKPCAFVCRICPVNALIEKLPDSVTEDNAEQVGAQLGEIFDLYDALTAEEQEQVDPSPCAALMEQIEGLGAEELSGDTTLKESLTDNATENAPREVKSSVTFHLNGHTLTNTAGTAIQVTGTGELELIGPGTVISKTGVAIEVQTGGVLELTGGGTVISEKDIAIEVQSDGTLTIAEDITVQGDENALIIASGANVRLSAGTYKGNPELGYPAINIANGADVSLETGCAFYDAEGNVLSLDDLAKATTVIIRQCTDHQKTYTHDAGTPTHTWTCDNCGTTETEKCTFDFEQDGNGMSACAECVNNLSIDVNQDDLSDLVYDGTLQPEEVGVTVTLTDPAPDGTGTTLVKGTDFSVDIEKLTDAGQATVTVTGITFNGTFVKTYTVEKAEPKIVWNSPTCSVDYDGQEVDNLPSVTITAVAGDDLSSNVQYAYKKTGDTDFTDGLPKDAGTYLVKAYLEESDNYKAMETETLLTLTINQINPIDTVPEATKPTYNRSAQELVTAGTLDPVAVAGGLTIEFATSQNGPWSTAIPTGTDAGDYTVWYQVTGLTDNYIAPDPNPAQVSGVKIQRKAITPTVTVQEPSYVYDGSKKQPKITVKDGTFVLDEGQYTVTWAGTKNQVDNNILRIADTYTATITGKEATDGGNYEFNETATVEIVPAAQNALKITGKPETVHYGDVIKSLETSGGTANGAVKWSVTPKIDGTTGVTIDETSGELTVKNVGTYTVKAERTVPNYGTVSDTWTFTVEPKAVTAEVTVTPKTYDGNTTANVTAAVKASDLVVESDAVALNDLTGTYDTPNAGTGKTVTLDSSGATATGTDAAKYTVSYPATAKGDINPKDVAVTVTLSGDGLLGDATNGYSYVFDNTEKRPTVTVEYTEGGTDKEIPASNYTVSYSNNINVGTATVTVTAKGDGNYTFENAPVTATFTIDKEQAKVITAPKAAGLPLVFSTYAQELVTAGTGSGGTMVYSTDGENGTYSADLPTKTDAAEYTVHYKVQGDDNHSDSAVGSVKVTIAPKTVNDPTIELFNADDTPLVSYTYDGTAKEPKVVVKDGSTVIDADKEYNIVYSDNTNAGHGTVDITDKPGGNYEVTDSKTFVINKANIVFNPVPSAANLTYDGTAHELLVPGTTTGGTVLYALNSATSAYSDAIPTGVNAGNYIVYYKVVGDKNHNDLNDLTTQKVDVTIQRKPLDAPTIELTPDSFQYDGAVHLPSVTVKDGDTVLPTSEYSWTCSEDSPTQGGTYTITVSDKTGGNYDLTGAVTANKNTATFTIGKAAQAELVIEGKPAVTNYGDTFTLTTSGGSGTGGLTWNAVGGNADIDTDGNVTIKNVGNVTINVVKAGDTNYQQTSAQWTFTAAPKPVTASVTVQSRDYDGTTAATVDTANIDADLVADDAVSIDPTSIKATFDDPHVGTGKPVTLDASKVSVTGDDATKAKYAITYPSTVTADITQATTTIDTAPAAIASLTYSGQPQALVTAGVTNVGFLVYSLSENGEYTREIPTGTDAGTHSVYYKVDGTDDYTGVAAQSVSVTIAPKNVTPRIEVTESSYVYDGAKKSPKITLWDGDTEIPTSQYTVTWANAADPAITDGVLTAVGTYRATIKNVTDGNYTIDVTTDVEITPAGQNAIHITGNPEHVYYGDVITTLGTEGGTGNGTVKWSITSNGNSATIEESTGKLTITGTGAVTVRAERTVPNYGTVGDNWNFTVEPKPVTAEVTIAAKTYNGDKTATVASVTVPTINGDTVTVAPTSITATFADPNAGTGKTVTLTGGTVDTANSTNADRYDVIIPATATGDITAKHLDTVTVTLSDHDLQGNATEGYYYEYDGTEKEPGVTVKDGEGNIISAHNYTFEYSNNKNVSTNTEKASVTVTANPDGNYTFTAATVNFEIRSTGAVLTSSPQARDLTYEKGTQQELVTVGTATGGTVVYKLISVPDSETGFDSSADYSPSIPTGTNAGTYMVEYKVKGDDNHTSTAPGQVSVTIKPKQITAAITLEYDTTEYDGTAKTPTVTAKDGTEPIDATEYSVSYRDNVNVGTATVVISDANGGNYTVSGTANFEITKAAPTLTQNPAGKIGLQYTAGPQDLLATLGTATGGTVVYSLDGVNYAPTMPKATAVATHTVYWKVEGDANHSDTTVATLTVNIAQNTVSNPTITLSQDQFTYDGNQHRPDIAVYDNNSRLIPAYEYTVSITGTNGNNGMVKADTYTVKITTPATSNYVIADDGTVNNTRTFKIVPADQESITITGTKAEVRYGDTIQLGVTGGTGNGTLTWEVKANGDGTVNSTISATGLLTVKDVGGPYTVTAKRTRENYGDVSATWEFTAGKKPVTAVVTAADRNYAENDTSATVTASVPNSELVSGDSITITGLTGTFSDPNVGADKKVTVNSSNPTVTGTN